MVKVSIIVPVYNVMKYLKKCLDSLIKQTLAEVEIILVNDASPDDSISIMEEYRREYPDKIRCIYLKNNLSQGGARNRGIEIAVGEYIMFVDSDDWVDTTICEKLYQEAVLGDYDIVGCDYYQVKEATGEKNWKSMYYRQQTGMLDDEKRAALMLSYAYTFCKIIRRDILVQNSLYFHSYMKYEDCALTPLFFVYADSMGIVEEPLYFYNIRANSTTQSLNIENHKDVIRAAEILRQEMIQRGLDRYQEVMDGLEIKLTFYLLKKFVPNMKQLKKENVNYLDKMISKIYPFCKNNRYYYSVTDAEGRQAAENLHRMRNVEEQECQYVITDLSYVDYYKYFKEKVSLMLEFCKIANYRIAIWGAGLKGNDFLSVFDHEAERITCVIDSNSKKHGFTTNTGHVIRSLEQVEHLIDFIIVINKNYYAGIKQEIKKCHSGVKAFNLECYLLTKASFIENYID